MLERLGPVNTQSHRSRILAQKTGFMAFGKIRKPKPVLMRGEIIYER
jgi:hypothetical protein